MNRTEYRHARRMARDNGRHALRWLPAQHREAAEVCFFDHHRDDPLAERARLFRDSPLIVRIRPMPLTE